MVLGEGRRQDHSDHSLSLLQHDGRDSLRGLGALRVMSPTQTGAGLGRVGVLLGVPQLRGTLASTKFEEFMLALPSWQDLGASWCSRGLGS